MTLSVVAMPQPSLVITPADIAAHWGIALEDNLEPIPALTNVVLRSDGYVVRCERRDVESVAWEHDLLLFLAADVPEIAAPLRALDGTTFVARARQIVSVLPYIEGEHLRRSDETARRELPDVLGRIHRRALAWPVEQQRPSQPSYLTLDWEKNLWWDLGLFEPSPVLADALDRTRAWLDSRPELTVCAIHGDLNPGNVLTRDGRIVAILDWSFARIDWATFDLACAVGLMALREDGSIDSAVARRVVGAYGGADGPGEADAVEPLLRIFFLAVSLFSLTLTARGQGSNPGMVALMERALTRLA
jgi:Ser/Thr protein kinase RdoA (MazF antagonist)